METLGEKVKRLRKGRKWSQQFDADGVTNLGGEMSREAVSLFERNETKNLKNINLYCMALLFETNIDELVKGTTAQGKKRRPNDVIPVTQSRSLPVLNYIQAGMPREAIDDFAPGAGMDYIYVDKRTAESLSALSFALEIVGDSMLDEFRPGDIVVIDPAINPVPGDFVVAKFDNHAGATFKRYRPRGNLNGSEVIELVSLNDDHPNYIMDGENPGHIVGTMIEHRRKRRR